VDTDPMSVQLPVIVRVHQSIKSPRMCY
jgi:hypothetical protein